MHRNNINKTIKTVLRSTAVKLKARLNTQFIDWSGTEVTGQNVLQS